MEPSLNRAASSQFAFRPCLVIGALFMMIAVAAHLDGAAPEKAIGKAGDESTPGTFDAALGSAKKAIETGELSKLKPFAQQVVKLNPKDEDSDRAVKELGQLVMKDAVAACRVVDFGKVDTLTAAAKVLRPEDPDVAKIVSWEKRASKPLFADGFPVLSLQHWEVDGGAWKVLAGRLSCIGDGKVFIKGFREKNFVASFDIMNGTRAVGYRLGVIFRHTLGGNLQFMLSTEYKGLVFEHTKGPTDVLFEYGKGRRDTESAKTYRVVVRCEDKAFECYLDGELIVRGTDEKPGYGKLGFLAGRADALFGKVAVYPAVPLPELQGTGLESPKAAK